MSYPYLKEENGKKILVVQGKPFIMLSGEVHNSNSSSVEYMEQVWDKADELGMNSLLLPVTWELTEPEEGKFDFSLVDGLITQARKRGKKLGFLWFGAWKNAQCYYAPSWVKTNLERFKRAEVEKGKNFTRLMDFHGMPYTSLSYLCEETNKSDARAFRELMLHIKEIDEQENTVVIMQVENETGLQGSARENSDEADALFEAEVPEQFVDYMKANTETMVSDVKCAVEEGAKNGNWKAVFGDVAEEIFSAYHIASYVNKVAQAGKEVYPLPMLANCWLDKGQKAGKYPSGGPVSRMMEVWKYCAPTIDIIAPDIYVPDFCGVCDEYTRRGNPLFIPEAATHSYAGPREVYAVGHYHAICYSPFGFEEMGEPFSGTAAYLFGVDTKDPALSTSQNVEEYGWYSRTLNHMMSLIAEKYGTTDLQAVIRERKDDDIMMFGSYGFKIMMDLPMITRKDGVCLVLKESEDQFYIIANGCAVIPFSANPGKPNVDILSLEEGKLENGKWKMIRRLNGDEVALMSYNKPTLLKIKIFAYK
jgi:hypothetical protein